MSQWDLMLGVLPSCWLRQWLPETPHRHSGTVMNKDRQSCRPVCKRLPR